MSSADTTSPLLALLLMGTGLHNDDWGDRFNDNLTAIENAIAGVGAIAGSAGGWAGGTYALNAAQTLPRVLIFSGALSANQVVSVPASSKSWLFDNRTTGGFTLTVVPVGGTGITLAQGVTDAYCDGANVYSLAIPSTPVGVIEEYYGVELPDNRFVWANGQTLSRAAYPALFNALTRSTTATVGGGATIPCSENLTGKGIVGSIVEGAGVPANTTVLSVTATTITLSNPTTGAAAPQTIRFFPFGNGDGASTFTTPDRREVVAIGNSVMGGSAAPGRITAASMAKGANLGNVVGEDRHATTIGEMPAHGHVVNDPPHTHGTTETPHTHNYRQTGDSNGGGGSSANSANLSYTNKPTDPASTGLTVNSSATGVSLQSTGGGQSHNNLQPTLVCNYILRAA